MFHHKLGWQTSDQQDKAVSCEVGVLLVLASALQAEVGGEASAQQPSCAAQRGRWCLGSECLLLS